MDYQDNLIESMMELDEKGVISNINSMLENGFSSNSIILCLNLGMSCVGNLFENGEYFIADLIVSGMIYRSALNLITPINSERKMLPIGRIVIGVVEGDIHDLGKDIVVSVLRAERFEVIDLGIDVRPARFIHAIETYRPDVLLMSGVLSIATDSMRETMKAICDKNLRDNIKILIGGMCTSEHLKNELNADAWSKDAMETASFCKQVVGEKYGSNK